MSGKDPANKQEQTRQDLLARSENIMILANRTSKSEQERAERREPVRLKYLWRSTTASSWKNERAVEETRSTKSTHTTTKRIYRWFP